ncbi:hypothetical protein B4107_0389 [Bacillus safensis]|nr:hypothetical protein B4107_0389 [Bacillus safensis]
MIHLCSDWILSQKKSVKMKHWKIKKMLADTASKMEFFQQKHNIKKQKNKLSSLFISDN